jgi:hypothetical protein
MSSKLMVEQISFEPKYTVIVIQVRCTDIRMEIKELQEA